MIFSNPNKYYHYTNNEMKQIQNVLGTTEDGVFNDDTKQAVKKFQKTNNLLATGKLGKYTMKKLMLNMDTDLTNIMKMNAKPEIEEHHLSKNQYLNGTYKNEYIILHHTAGHDDPSQVIDSWEKDSLGRVATEFVIGGIRGTDGRNTYDGKILRAFPEGNQGYHIGNCGSSHMSTHSVGIEMCNIGWTKLGKSYVNTVVKPDQIVTLTEAFRGYKTWQRYTEKQIESLRLLLLYIADRDNIDLHTGLYEWIKNEGATKAFDFHQDAYYGKIKGLLTHANIRKDKFDCSPQQDLVDMILTL